jgi:hypothetical protein
MALSTFSTSSPPIYPRIPRPVLPGSREDSLLIVQKIAAIRENTLLGQRKQNSATFALFLAFPMNLIS